MNGKENAAIRYFWFTDLLVVLVCLSTAAGSIYLFRRDLMRTIDSYDQEPAGIIIIRNNVVQRRHEDRVLWDRIFVDSPVYAGDLIRAADLSAATIYIDTNQIDLNENTLIRIKDTPEKQGAIHIELQEGNLSLNTGTEGAGITLNLMGREVQATAGTVLNAEMGDEGLIVQVNEGNATFVEKGQSRELGEGTMLAQDSKGVERIIPAAIVMRPRPNARFLKTTDEALSVDFSWKSINIEAGGTLRLEIAGDSGFTKDLTIIDDFSSIAKASFNDGLWYWRLAYENDILSSGQLTVADATGPELQSPVMNSVFRYYGDLPQLRFQWSPRPGASHYTIEISADLDFKNPAISKQVSSASCIQAAPGPGAWYWRVLPGFSSVYDGSAAYSSTASFRIEQTNDPKAPAIELPPPPKPDITVSDYPTAGQHYMVKQDDTIANIAWKAYKRAAGRLIIDANKLANPNVIEVNDVLYLPPL